MVYMTSPSNANEMALVAALQDQLDSLQQKYQQLDRIATDWAEKCQSSQIEYDALQHKWKCTMQENDRLRQIVEHLETQITGRDQEIESLQAQLQQAQRAQKEMTRTHAMEKQEFECERQLWQQQEDQYLATQRRLSAPAVSGPPSARKHEKADTKSADHDKKQQKQRLMQHQTMATQKRIIDELQLRLLRQITTHNDQMQAMQREITHWQEQMHHVQQINQSLMEENEGYQRLAMHHDVPATNANVREEKHAFCHPTPPISPTEQTTRPALRLPTEIASYNLADELTRASAMRTANQGAVPCDEIKTLRDTNETLQRYVDSLLLRIVENKQTEQVLRINKHAPTTLTIRRASQDLASKPLPSLHTRHPSPPTRCDTDIVSPSLWQRLVRL
ncbi:hypothetical protein BC940DRAFT_344311 [Gongronella butleri]|nr:hypothetical protein BC940DRAFT_344311 [Gongronella butleri]